MKILESTKYLHTLTWKKFHNTRNNLKLSKYYKGPNGCRGQRVPSRRSPQRTRSTRNRNFCSPKLVQLVRRSLRQDRVQGIGPQGRRAFQVERKMWRSFDGWHIGHFLVTKVKLSDWYPFSGFSFTFMHLYSVNI